MPGIGIPLQCPNETQLADFKTAVQNGWIVWHAFPFNSEIEIMDDSLFEYGLSMAFELDDYFQLPHKIALSQRY